MLFGETAFVIPLDNIISLDKKVKALIFDTAISIVSKKGELIFASFLARDECLSLLTKLHNKDEIKLE